jgi:pimeloyl-ACP methyl ester carboxylesterase
MAQLPTFSTLGSGPTILMLHGIGGGHRAFAPQVESFAGAGYRAVAWDMPGYGRSPPIEPYNFKGLAQSCVALMEALVEKQAKKNLIVLGHSMGGMVAQEVVSRRPDLVRQLILCGTSAAFGKPDGDWQKNFLAERTAPLDAGQSMAELADALVPQMIGPASLPEGIELARSCMGAVNPSTYRRALQALMGFDRRADLARIAVPTLLIAGEYDKNAPPAVMKKMADAIPGSDYLEMRGIGHLQNLEAPEDFDGAVLNFLALPRELH